MPVIRAQRVVGHLRWRIRRVALFKPTLAHFEYVRVTLFFLRATRLARSLNDEFALTMRTPLDHVLLLMRLADGKKRVVEVGTASGWTSCAFVLADGERTVRSFDPFDFGNRESYMRLAGRSRNRITVNQRPGSENDGMPVDFLFIDASHEREPTIAEFQAWQPLLTPNAVVAFHDYTWGGGPAEHRGVAEAIAQLNLSGEVIEGIFVHRVDPNAVNPNDAA